MKLWTATILQSVMTKQSKMVQLPPAEPNEANAIEKFTRLTTTNSQRNIDQLTDGQPITHSHNSNECNTLSNNIISPDNQSTIIPHQFSIMAEELKNFTKQVLNDITKMVQAHNTAQEHTGKLIENAISQTLTKAWDIVASSPTTVNTNIQDINYTSPSYESNWDIVGPHSIPLCHTPDKLTHIQHIDTKKHEQIQKLIQLNNNRMSFWISSNPPDFNQSVVELLKCPTELTHSTQCLHQQTTDALHSITKSSSLQENLHFIHDIPMFKAKYPQSFDEWLDHIDKVASLTNNNQYKLALAKSQGSFSKAICSYPPRLGWNKIKECLHGSFGSVVTGQPAASMLINQQ